MTAPHLTFFCELPDEQLGRTFADPEVIKSLLALGARVSLAITDLSTTRAAAVRFLNEAGIPVVAWLLLPEADGYWFSSKNAALARQRWRDVLAWTHTEELRWDGVGLDAEVDMRDVELLAADGRSRLKFLLSRLGARSEMRRARDQYRQLVDEVRDAKIPAEHYLIPILFDEHAAGSTLVQWLTGIVDMPADRHVPMLYTSLFRKFGGPGVLASYAEGARSIAVGSTGGGVTVAGFDQIRPLDWKELSRDLLLARRFSDDLFVFSLEGCVEQGFLEPLVEFDWDAEVRLPAGRTDAVNRFRRRLGVILKCEAMVSRILGYAAGLGKAPLRGKQLES